MTASFIGLHNPIECKLQTMKSTLYYCLILLTLPLLLHGQDQEEARKIFEEVDQRRSSVTYEKAEMRMVIYDSRGNTRNRTLQSFSYNEGEKSNSLLIFKEPANVRGTAFLTLSEGSEETQKLYLPALGRIQTISASEKSDRFMGSDFTYEDLGDQNPADYSFELKAQTDTAHVLRATKKENSQYDHLLFYIDPDTYALLRIAYFNADGEMIKKLVAEEHRKVNEQLWQPQKMTMYDLENDRRTELYWNNRTVGQPIPQWRFTERGLRRGL